MMQYATVKTWNYSDDVRNVSIHQVKWQHANLGKKLAVFKVSVVQEKRKDSRVFLLFHESSLD